jgi:hypothetical protein
MRISNCTAWILCKCIPRKSDGANSLMGGAEYRWLKDMERGYLDWVADQSCGSQHKWLV